MTLSILIHILVLLVLSIISALIGFGFNKMQDNDMIFEKYKELLEYLARNRFKTIRYRIFEFKLWYNTVVVFKLHVLKLPYFKLGNSHYWKCSTSISHRKSKVFYYLTKPLGLCIICNTTWIGIIACLIVATKWNYMLIFDAITTGISSAAIVILLINKFNQLQRDK